MTNKIPYGFIYITECLVNGKRYIGQRRYRGRWHDYLGSGHHLIKAIQKYGREQFKRTVIAEAYDLAELNTLEIELIRKYDAVNDPMWYNISPGGRGRTRGFTGRKHTEETKEKMRKNHRRPVTDNVRRACSANGRLSSQNREARRKQAESMSGAKHFRAKSITINGITYPTFSDAKRAGYTYRDIIDISKGIITEPLGKRAGNVIPITINGVRYNSILQAERELGLPRSAIIKLGKTSSQVDD